MNEDEFINEYELTAPTVNLPPIILIPGVGGSKLTATNKQTGQKQTVWINPTL